MTGREVAPCRALRAAHRAPVLQGPGLLAGKPSERLLSPGWCSVSGKSKVYYTENKPFLGRASAVCGTLSWGKRDRYIGKSRALLLRKVTTFKHIEQA